MIAVDDSIGIAHAADGDFALAILRGLPGVGDFQRALRFRDLAEVRLDQREQSADVHLPGDG